jgi:elongation factor G
MAFRICAIEAFKQAFRAAKPCLQEPIMKVEIETPTEYQGNIVSDLNSRRGIIQGTENHETYALIRAEVPLARMIGYSTNLRSMSKGMATFSMEMSHYARVPQQLAEEVILMRKQQKEHAKK